MHNRAYENRMKLIRERKALIEKSIRDKEDRVKQVLQAVEFAMQNLSGKEESKIQNDPEIRQKFAQLCSIMEVDPLLISKSNQPKKEGSLVQPRIST